jgi:hypothetical protein
LGKNAVFLDHLKKPPFKTRTAVFSATALSSFAGKDSLPATIPNSGRARDADLQVPLCLHIPSALNQMVILESSFSQSDTRAKADSKAR